MVPDDEETVLLPTDPTAISEIVTAMTPIRKSTLHLFSSKRFSKSNKRVRFAENTLNSVGLANQTRWLARLSRSASYLKGALYDSLIQSILKSEVQLLFFNDLNDGQDEEWDCEKKNHFTAFLSFLTLLASAQPIMTPKIVRKLIQLLRICQEDLDSQKLGEDLSYFYEQLHEAIARILVMVPSACNALLAALAEEWQSVNQMIPSLLNHFATHTLQITNYAPVIREKIIELYIAKLVRMDIDVTVDLDDLEQSDMELMEKIENGEGAVENENGSESELESESGEDFESDYSDEEADEARAKLLKRMNESLRKCDIMLSVLFSYIDKLQSKDSLPHPVLNAVFLSLLSSFDRYLLTTPKTRYTQLALFYCTSLHPSFADTFLSYLIHRTIDASSPKAKSHAIRGAAAHYLMSYLARAKSVDTQDVARCLKVLTSWAHRFVDDFEDEREKIPSRKMLDDDVLRYPVFYAVVQCVMYVFVFRWRELVGSAAEDESVEKENSEDQTTVEMAEQLPELDSDDESCYFSSMPTPEMSVPGTPSTPGTPQKYYRNTFPSDTFPTILSDRQLYTNKYMGWWYTRGGFQRVLTCTLQPLTKISSNVIHEFSKLTNKLNICYCPPPVMDACVSKLKLQNVMESFFPFDPYFERLTVRDVVEQIYLRWDRGVEEEKEEE